MKPSNHLRTLFVWTLWSTAVATIVLTVCLVWPLYRDQRKAEELVRMPTDYDSLEFFRKVERMIEERSEGQFVVPMLSDGTKHPDAHIRWRSVMALKKFAEAKKQVYPALIEALADEEKRVRMWASAALGELCTQSIPMLIDTLASPNPRLRAGALEALGSMGSDAAETLPHVLKAAKDDDARVREYAIWALGRIAASDEEVVACLIESLDDSEPKVRREAVGALGASQLSDVAPILRQFLNDDPEIRQWASYMLHRQSKAMDQIMPALVAALQDSRQDVRVNAACALGRIGDQAREAVPALQKLLTDDDPTLRFPAARSIWQITGECGEAMATIIATLRDENDSWCWAAMETLGEMGSEAGDAVATVVELARKHSDYQWQAIKILKLNQQHPDLSVPALIEALNSQEVQVRQEAALALATYGLAAKDALPVLRRLTQHPFLGRVAKDAIAEIDTDSDESKNK